MMYQNLPYKEVYVKKSFLTGPKNFKWGKDETVAGILVGIKSVFRATPLFEVYFPEYQACYDKVLQCAVFERPETPDEIIKLSDVGWWNCLSQDIQVYEKALFKNSSVRIQSKNGKTYEGTYLWTLDFSPIHTNEGVDFSESQYWSEHKQANFLFDKRTGALICGPNNKMRYIDASLSSKDPPRPFFKVFGGGPWSHHDGEVLMGDVGDNFDYYSETKEK